MTQHRPAASAASQYAGPSGAPHRGKHEAPPAAQAAQGAYPVPAAASFGAHAAPASDFFSEFPAEGAVVAPRFVMEKKRDAKKTAVVVAFVIGLLLVVYAAGAFFFASHFYPRTSMGSLDLSLMSRESAIDAVSAAGGSYKLSVSGQGLSFTVTPADSGMGVDAPAIVSNALSSLSALKWPVDLLFPHDVSESLVATVDGSALGDYVKQQMDEFNAGQEPSADAYVAYDADANAYAIVPEFHGGQLSADAVVAKVSAALCSFDGAATLDESDLIKPEVLSDDPQLASSLESANALLGCEGDVVFGTTGVKVATIDSDVVSQFVVFDAEGKAALDDDAVRAWVSEFAKSLSTVGTTRTFTRGDGESVTATGGDYGWAVSADSAVETIEEAIYSRSTGQITLDATHTGNGYVSANQDWGAYVDVDLTEQHARYYDASGKLLWESDFISGSYQHMTPTGIYFLKGIQRDQVLIGKPDPETKKPEYETPVKYWMPFIGNAVGFHDAPWQSDAAFADPAAFSYTGSHGCVNLPPSKAAELFDIIKLGDAVVVHN